MLFRAISTAVLFTVTKTRDDFDGTPATSRSAVDGGAGRPISQISNNNGEWGLCFSFLTKITCTELSEIMVGMVATQCVAAAGRSQEARFTFTYYKGN